MSFGWKQRELDIGPPHCRFERSDTQDQGALGFDKLANFGTYYIIRPIQISTDC